MQDIAVNDSKIALSKGIPGLIEQNICLPMYNVMQLNVLMPVCVEILAFVLNLVHKYFDWKLFIADNFLFIKLQLLR